MVLWYLGGGWDILRGDLMNFMTIGLYHCNTIKKINEIIEGE